MSGFGAWIGVDLDGTLAEHTGVNWDGMIGKPVPRMLARVRHWLDEGKDVRIMTARVAPYFLDTADTRHPETQRFLVQQWCVEHLGQVLPVTCSKDYGMVELWDDRAVRVEFNTGRIAGEECE